MRTNPSYADLKQSYVSDYLKLSLFPTSYPVGPAFECKNGCVTPYDTPVRWYMYFSMVAEKIPTCPVCRTTNIEMIGLYRQPLEDYHWLWKVGED